MSIHPQDFDHDSGKKKIILLLDEMRVNLHELERKIEKLEEKESRTEKDIEDILKTEDK